MEKNKRKAVALAYDVDEVAPMIVAKGEGIIAQNIINKGLEEDIVIYEDEDLVDSLIKLDINTEIPADLYEVVAQVIYYVYSIDGKKGID